MKDVVNALQVAAVSLMVIPLGTERLTGRKARLENVRYCRKNNIAIPTRKKFDFCLPHFRLLARKFNICYLLESSNY